jgi:hypothetical protein
MKLKFTDPEFFILAAASVVADRFEAYKDIFTRDHSNWKDPFISCYKKKIGLILSKYYNIRTTEELRTSVCFLWRIYTNSLDDLTMIKKQIEWGFEDNPLRREALLDKLGFITYWNKASHNNQVAMFSLLLVFYNKLSEDLILRAELESKGIVIRLIYNILSYKEVLLSSKIHQMETIEFSALMREELVYELNDIYHKAMSICMIGKYLFRTDKEMQDLFNFSKIIKLNGSFNAADESNTDKLDWCNFSLSLVNENECVMN